MDRFIQEVNTTWMNETRPHYVVIINPSNAADIQKLTTQEFAVGTYQTVFIQVIPGVLYSYASGMGSVLRDAIQQHLGHSNFVLSAIV